MKAEALQEALAYFSQYHQDQSYFLLRPFSEEKIKICIT